MSSLSADSQRDSSSDHQPSSQPDRPERSRNAKAQARHRAKRKAYIEQVRYPAPAPQSPHTHRKLLTSNARASLDHTTTRPLPITIAPVPPVPPASVLALSPDQVAAIPPPLLRIRELEQENDMLHREVEELRRQLEIKNAQLRGGGGGPDLGLRREPFGAALDDHRSDREPKRRRTSDASGLYVTHSPPPPLTIPSVASQYTSQSPPHSSGYAYSSSRPGSASFYPSYGVSAYAVPETPSSSTASSPSFSASVLSVSAAAGCAAASAAAPASVSVSAGGPLHPHQHHQHQHLQQQQQQQQQQQNCAY
ncbi:hypothetical protein C8Q73DRAFT_785926 [Cubamyces lactineus]|nr:hypothetical protein C8Q73DRAFT_785926 [Cubamyces lactineus]